jgi:hypothetical protein
MVGVISGLAAFATSKLGLAGTVIGAVIGSMLYQVMSHFVREPLENVKTKRIEREIFYVFPLILILIIEIIYLLSAFYLQTGDIFYFLEFATGGNLFKTMGISLIIMGIYPVIKPESIPRHYGVIIMAIGFIKLLWGFIDVNSAFVSLYSPLFFQFNEVISIAMIIALSYVIISLVNDSVTLIMEREETDNNQEN